MQKIFETIMTASGSDSWSFSCRWRRLIIFSVFFLGFLFAGTQQAKAALGLNREAYGVWDRAGGHSVSTYPYTRGQEYAAEWTAVNPARSNFNWTAMDSLLQLAYDQNQRFFVKIQPVASTTVPPWIFSAGVPQIVCPGLTYGYPLDPEYKLYLSEMVIALGKHLREDVPAHLRDIVSLVRVDTGATGDEGPYDPPDLPSVPTQYQISGPDWQAFRIWLFGVYDQAFQHGTGPAIPLIFQDIETPAFATEQDWVKTNVTAGFGAKYGGQVRGHHLSESRNVPDSYKAYSMDTPMKFFSANEMDQTWEKPYFQLNIKLSMYWCAVEQLNAGLTIWDWTASAVEGASANGFVFTADLFNTWAAELDPATARGGFCIFHEGLDSSDTVKFPTGTYGSASKGNTARYTAICEAYASQGAKMGHLTAATWGQVAQRRDQTNFNDSGWEIWPDNYERFITQINPTNTSLALWRVRGTLTASSHPYDRFARRFDSASGKNTMYFDVNDHLTPTPGQSIKLSVVYLDSGTGQFGLLYDAVGNSQKSAFTVTKANSNTWKTNSVVVTDWVLGNNGPNGADLMLTSVDSNDDTFSRIELVKLVNVTMNKVGQGTVSARTDGTVYSPVTGTNYATGQRLEMKVTPAADWTFSGWSGDLSGSNSRAILFPTNVNTQVTAIFTAIPHTLAITNGTGSGDYTNGQHVAIVASNAPAGQVFTYWTGNTNYLIATNVFEATNTVVMGTWNIQLTANYITPLYTLTVNGGSGSGYYYAGTELTIVATNPPSGYVFDRWTGDTASLVEPNAASTTFFTPAANTAVTATYKSAAVTLTATVSGGNGTITPASASVSPGNSTNFVITANNYYRIATLTTNGASAGMAFNNLSTNYTYTRSNVQVAGTVTVSFVQQVTTNAPAPVSHSWLAGYFTTNDYNAAANADQDVDGLLTWQEYIAGTVPTNKTSCFTAVQSNRNVVTWSPVTGRVYSVYWSTNLLKGITNKIADNILYPTNSYTNATPDPRVNLYQIKVRMQ